MANAIVSDQAKKRTRLWDRFGTVGTALFDQYGVGRGGWHRDMATDGQVVEWQDWQNDVQRLAMPDADAAECEWQAFFTLLEMRLKFMPRAA